MRIRREPTAYDWYAGTNVDLKVVLLGEMGPAPPDFQTRIEHTPEGTNVPTGIENLPVTFARRADGDYHGTLVLTKTGSDRIEVSVKGTSAAGLAFTDRAIFRAQVQPALK